MTRQEDLLPREHFTGDDLGQRAARMREIDRKHRERVAPVIEARNAEEAAKKRARQAASNSTDPDSTEENR